MSRQVTSEMLDHLAPDDPAAMRSRRDLVRVHRAMGTRGIVMRGWRALLERQRGGVPLRILEIGAGDGSLLLGVARAMAPQWPSVELTLLDRQDIVSPATLAGYAELGWAVDVHVTDVLSWADRRDSSERTAPSPRWDLITTTLFLHHFEGHQLDRLLAAVALRTDRFFACEPKRSWLSLVGSHLVGAIFSGSMLPRGQISVLALDGGYGGMVVADQGTTTLACCIRRDRLSALRGGAAGLSASEAVQAWLLRECAGVRLALQDASRDGAWLSSGPLDPGVRLDANDGIFRVGNAAGEAHPILGEGMSMALQSAALLCSHLLRNRDPAAVPDAASQVELQRAYVASWRRQFAPRLRLAAVFAHLAMRPPSAAALMRLLQMWPRLLTQAARWGGKVRTPELEGPTVAAGVRPPGGRRSPKRRSLSQPREEST